MNSLSLQIPDWPNSIGWAIPACFWHKLVLPPLLLAGHQHAVGELAQCRLVLSRIVMAYCTRHSLLVLYGIAELMRRRVYMNHLLSSTFTWMFKMGIQPLGSGEGVSTVCLILLSFLSPVLFCQFWYQQGSDCHSPPHSGQFLAYLQLVRSLASV